MYAPLDAVLTHHQTLRLLLGYVCYAYNPTVQSLALMVAHQLVPRVPNIVDVLVEQSEHGVEDCIRIRSGFGACLQSSVFQPGVLVAEGGDEDDR